jgi:hypothetical protein
MQNAAGDGVAQAPHEENDAYRAVVSDLVGLVEHIQKSLRLIERTIAGETSPGNPESSINVIVLDDVSPRYMTAAAALQACDVNLGIALHSLRNPGDGDPHAASLPAFSVVALPVIAGGVETEEQRTFLAREGCQVQGYLIGRPEPTAHYRHLVTGLAAAAGNAAG